MPHSIDPAHPSADLPIRCPAGTAFVATAVPALLFLTAPVSAVPVTEHASHEQVRSLLAHTYDQTAHKVETDPIAIAGPQGGSVFLALENLFDRKYAYRPGYPMPGRSAHIGASASF